MTFKYQGMWRRSQRYLSFSSRPIAQVNTSKLSLSASIWNPHHNSSSKENVLVSSNSKRRIKRDYFLLVRPDKFSCSTEVLISNPRRNFLAIISRTSLILERQLSFRKAIEFNLGKWINRSKGRPVIHLDSPNNLHMGLPHIIPSPFLSQRHKSYSFQLKSFLSFLLLIFLLLKPNPTCVIA